MCDIFPAINEEQRNVSRHLAVLKSAGLVTSRKEGPNVHYRMKGPRLFQLLDGVDAVLHTHLREPRQVTRRLAAQHGRPMSGR